MDRLMDSEVWYSIRQLFKQRIFDSFIEELCLQHLHLFQAFFLASLQQMEEDSLRFVLLQEGKLEKSSRNAIMMCKLEAGSNIMSYP
jgi:hypothetical protein